MGIAFVERRALLWVALGLAPPLALYGLVACARAPNRIMRLQEQLGPLPSSDFDLLLNLDDEDCAEIRAKFLSVVPRPITRT